MGAHISAKRHEKLLALHNKIHGEGKEGIPQWVSQYSLANSYKTSFLIGHEPSQR